MSMTESLRLESRGRTIVFHVLARKRGGHRGIQGGLNEGMLPLLYTEFGHGELSRIVYSVE